MKQADPVPSFCGQQHTPRAIYASIQHQSLKLQSGACSDGEHYLIPRMSRKYRPTGAAHLPS